MPLAFKNKNNLINRFPNIKNLKLMSNRQSRKAIIIQINIQYLEHKNHITKPQKVKSANIQNQAIIQLRL